LPRAFVGGRGPAEDEGAVDLCTGYSEGMTCDCPSGVRVRSARQNCRVPEACQHHSQKPEFIPYWGGHAYGVGTKKENRR